ncbi:MAG TPA: ABC transporter ATP-binding protein [Acidimicrobiia bacterium]|nr:ABC transporter ATP-binding protein [Acidimicrobiia bacterium]
MEGVVVTYAAGRDGKAVRAVDGVDLTVADGEIVCVLGPSGSGKSTLLRAVAGLEPLAAGRVRRDGVDLAGVPTHRRNLGLMFQDHALFPHRDVLGNVAFGLRMHDVPKPEATARAREALARVGLAGFEGRSVRSLSGGEQQRVALARALAPEPGLLMLDEPLGSIDRALRDRLVVEVRELLVRLGMSALFVTHDHDEALAVADRVAIMHAGRIEQQGPAIDVWRRPATRFVARFLGWNVTRLAAVARAAGGAGAGPVAVRPDGLVPDPAGPLAGTVAARTFRRDHFLLRVDVEGEPLDVTVRGDHVPAVGDPVRLTVDPAATVVLGTLDSE